MGLAGCVRLSYPKYWLLSNALFALAAHFVPCCNKVYCMHQFPQFDLPGQVALVTGAARGLGRAIALALAHAGADVALGLRDVHAHGDLPREIEALGRRALPLQMDINPIPGIERGAG